MRFKAIESSMDNMTSHYATTERKLNDLVKSHHAIINTVITFAEKQDALTARLEKAFVRLFQKLPPRTPQPSTSSPPWLKDVYDPPLPPENLKTNFVSWMQLHLIS